MAANTLVRDTAIGALGGLVAGKVMNAGTSKMLEMQTEEAKQTEEEASDGVSYAVVAKKTAGAVGLGMSEERAMKLGTAFHYALAMAWAPVYMWLRRSRGYSPFGAAAAAGTSLYLVVDELANPLLGFTPPPKAYPLVTHLRGLAGHLLYGSALAAAIEGGWRLSGAKCR